MTIFSEIDGVYSSGIHCGIKSSNKLDLAFIFVPKCIGSAIVLSRNLIRSATLDHNEEVFKNEPIKLLIINSGNANSVTGPIGIKHIQQTVQTASDQFNCKPSEIGIASTGIIGVPLPIDRLLKGIAAFNPRDTNGDSCADAILTTDLIRKHSKKSIIIQEKTIIIEGITKGSGMIAPNMATTLGFIVTNLSLNSKQCKRAIKKAIDQSYNMLSVDTDSSTNDMVTLQSTGQYNLTLSDKDILAFESTLTEICIDLAKQIASDGEGATHLIEVNISGAHSLDDAKTVAKNVVDSPLVKTAIAGNDPNWGRIVMAIGKAPLVKIDRNSVSIAINSHSIFESGNPLTVDRDKLKLVMSEKNITIDICIGNGPHSTSAWGCDLTTTYVDINTQYN